MTGRADRPEPAGRVLWAGLHLLDRQLVDRHGRMAGCIDDLELSASEDGRQLFVTAVLSGPGVLVGRFGHRRLSRWLGRVNAFVSPSDADPTRIPFNVVAEIGNHVTVAAEAGELGTGSTERWFRDHVIAPMPGSNRAPE